MLKPTQINLITRPAKPGSELGQFVTPVMFTAPPNLTRHSQLSQASKQAAARTAAVFPASSFDLRKSATLVFIRYTAIVHLVPRIWFRVSPSRKLPS